MAQWRNGPRGQDANDGGGAGNGNDLFAKYFSNLNPVLDGGVGGFADMEEELDNAMKGSTTANT